MKKMPSDGMLNVPEGSSIDNLQLKQLQSQYYVKRNTVLMMNFKAVFSLTLQTRYGAKKTEEETDRQTQTDRERQRQRERRRDRQRQVLFPMTGKREA